MTEHTAETLPREGSAAGGDAFAGPRCSPPPSASAKSLWRGHSPGPAQAVPFGLPSSPLRWLRVVLALPPGPILLSSHLVGASVFRCDFCTLKADLEVLLFWATALAARTPKSLTPCRSDTAAHLQPPRLLGLEPPARAGHRSGSLQPFAAVPRDKVSSCDPVLRARCCAPFTKPLPSPRLDSLPRLNGLFGTHNTKRREQTESNITPWLVDGGRQPAPR